jgi:hypothetical protein
MKKLRLGFIGNFGVSYSTESDRVWSFEKLGHKVIKLQENQTSYLELKEIISNNQIDVLFYSHTHGWEIKNLIAIFGYCEAFNIPTVSVHLDRWAWLDRVKDVGQEATWFTKYQFMADGSPEAVELYEKHNLNWYWLKPGVIERDCYLAQPDKTRFPHDIIFVGSRGYHPEYPGRPQLVDFLKFTYGDRFGHYGGDGLGTMREHNLNTLYASAKVVVGDSCFGGRPRYWSDRVTETIGRGGFLLHPACEGLDIPGMIPYVAGDFDGLKKLIDHYLEYDLERENMRSIGQEFVKNNETYTQRSDEMLKIIFGNE